MQAIIQSFLLVALTEMGDKTQLLAFVLASRFKKPGAVLAGILVATIANHLLAASFGSWIAQTLPAELLKWILTILFIGFAGWILIPDKDDSSEKVGRWGAFYTTLVTFFIAEMGDKTQLSTVALAAKFENITLVTLGTTLGMLFSDGLAVIFGKKITEKIPMKWIRIIAAAFFVIFGLAIYFGF